MVLDPRDRIRGGELDLFARKVLIAALIAAALLLLWAVRSVVVLIFLSAVLAAGIAPAVQRVRLWARHFLHRNIPRGTSVLLVYLPLSRYVPVDGARAVVRGGIHLPRSSVVLYLRNAATAAASFVAVLFMVGYMHHRCAAASEPAPARMASAGPRGTQRHAAPPGTADELVADRADHPFGDHLTRSGTLAKRRL